MARFGAGLEKGKGREAGEEKRYQKPGGGAGIGGMARKEGEGMG